MSSQAQKTYNYNAICTPTLGCTRRGKGASPTGGFALQKKQTSLEQQEEQNLFTLAES